jgi:hypothetical protein
VPTSEDEYEGEAVEQDSFTEVFNFPTSFGVSNGWWSPRLAMCDSQFFNRLNLGNNYTFMVMRTQVTETP